MLFQLICTFSLMVNLMRTINRLFMRSLDLNTIQNTLLIITTISLYTARFFEHYQEEEDFYYAHARAAGAVLKYTFPLVFFPMLRVLNDLFHELPATKKIAQEIDRHKIHQLLGISITTFAGIHAASHILNKGTLKLHEQEGLTGFMMLGLLLGPIGAMYLWRFKLQSRFSYYYQFLLPHQIGWWGLLLSFAYHTQDLRLLPISLFLLSSFSLDRFAEWFRSKTTTVDSTRAIHDSMIEVLLHKPHGYPEYRPGSVIWISVPMLAFLINRAHPLTLACSSNEEKIRLLISANGAWSTGLREILVRGYRLQLTSPFPSRLSLHEIPDRMIIITTGSGMAAALAYLNSFSEKRKPNHLEFYHSCNKEEEIELLCEHIEKSPICPDKIQFNMTGVFSKSQPPIKNICVVNERLNPKTITTCPSTLFYCGNRFLGKKVQKICSPYHDVRMERL